MSSSKIPESKDIVPVPLDPVDQEASKLGIFGSTRPPPSSNMKYINEDEMMEKLSKYLFNPKIKPDPGNFN